MRKTSKKIVNATLGVATMLTMILMPFGTGNPLGMKLAKADTYTVTGFVYLADGVTPVSDAHPFLMYPDRSFYLDTAPSGSSGPVGYYSFSGVAAGSYLLQANPPDGMTGVIRSNEIMITVGSGVTTQNISLNSTPKTVTGTVTYRGTTTPVVGAQVNAWSMGNGMGGGNQVSTDASGNYTLPLPPSSQYGMGLNAPAGADWTYNEPQVIVSFAADSSAESRTVSFQVTKATATITGTVTYASNGAPVTEGNVNAWSANGTGGGGNAQISNGTYTMKVPAGMFNVGFWSPTPNLTAVPTLVNISDGQTVTANLSVKAKTAHLVGRTVDTNGVTIAGAKLHAWCRPLTSTQNGGPTPGVDGNTESTAAGTFDIAILSGICNVNIDQGGMNNTNETAYVLKTQIPDTTVDTDTTTVNLGDVVMVKADATIHVTVKNESGAPVTGIQGNVNAQKATTDVYGPGENYGAPLNSDGTATIRLPSSVFSLVKLNMYMGQDSEYSTSDVGSTVSVVANATTEAVLTLVKNNSSIYGSLVDSNGIPLSKCTPPAGQFSFGDVYVNNSQNNSGRNAQFKEDCSYKVSLVAGTYQFGYNFREGSGLLNTPPGPDPVVIKAGENVVKNITVLVGDAKIQVQVLNSSGTPVPNAYVNISNEVELFNQPNNGGQNNGPKDLQGSGFKDKNGKDGDAFQICSVAYQKKDTKQIKLCEGMKLPDISKGPGGCSNVGACVKFCMIAANKSECGKFSSSQNTNKPGQVVVGPGGCKTDTECKAYCSKPANQPECSKFSPPAGQMTGASFFKGKVKGESTQNANVVGGPKPEDFKNVLRTGGMTDRNGVVGLSVVSGHKYEVMANPQPGSADMPAKSQVVDLTKGKSANVTLAFRQADAKISGKVTGGGPNGYCHGWEESGNFSGGEIRNGKYEINVSKGVWHIGCDSAWDRNFARSEEIVIVVDGTSKAITQNFKLDTNSNFRIPPAYSSTFDATAAQTIVLEDGTTIIASASAFATSGNITLTATPTANLQSQMNAKPAWYGYEFSAKDSNGADITKFNSNVTIIFKYTDAMLAASGVDESALLPRYFDESTNTWKSPDNTSQDLTANTITITTDHFSKHALTSNGKATNLVTITKGTGKNKGTFTVGKKKVSAFPGTDINVATAAYGGKTGQLIFVAPAANLKKGTSSVKVYGTSGKLVKTITPYKNNGAISLLLADFTKDGKNDLATSQSTGKNPVLVYNVMSKYKSYSLDTGAKSNSTVRVSSLAAQQVGVANLTLLVQTRGKNSVKVYGFNKGKFAPSTTLNEKSARISISGTSVSLKILKPSGKITSGKLATTSKAVKLTIKGANFQSGAVVNIGSLSTTVKVKNDKEMTVTLDGTTLTKGKTYTLTIVNPDGGKFGLKVKAT